MRHVALLVATLVLPTACSTEQSAPSAQAAEAGPTTPPTASPASASGDSKALPDVATGLEGGACNNGPGNVGADSWFTGTFTLNGSQVSGIERWILYANDKWKAKGGHDCEVRWVVHGRTGTPRRCSDCDLALVVEAKADFAASTCPDDLVKRERLLQEAYDVRRNPDGTATFYFSKSGKMLGQGYHNATQINYLSDHQCKWF